MTEEDWESKSFPTCFPDGQNHLHQKRNVRLTDQYYFAQRLRNKDPRFASNTGYIYAAACYLEKQQLQRNINLSYRHGRETKVSNDGIKSYKLDDGNNVFNKVSNTPKYWQTTKFEMLARLDNEGPFQAFFTLSSADTIWDENFSSILHGL